MSDYKTKTFKEGETILNEGDQPEYAYILKSGSAQVFKKKADGSKALISHLKPGDIIGEMSLIDAAPRSASVVTTEESKLIMIDQKNFDKSLDSLDGFASQLIKTMVRRLRIQNKQIAELSEPFNLLKAAEKGQLAEDKSAPTRVIFSEDYREKLHFEAIKILLVTKNSQTRQGIKGGMHLQGFREIMDCSNAVDFRSICSISDFDLIYVDDSIGLEDATKVIDDIRHDKTHVNPFCVIFAAIDHPDPQTLEKFADAGLDDILVKPVTIGNIIDRVEKRIKSRKSFVVTIDYVGPDRRSNPRPGREEIPLVDVPNPVSFKANGTQDNIAFQKQTAVALKQIESLKVERHAVQIEWLRVKIKTLNEEKQDPSFFLNRTREVTQSLVEKLRKRDDEVHIAQCNRIISIIGEFQDGTADMSGPDWDSFTNLTLNLKADLGPK